ncbi:hypothetical protein PHLGIDRAFT_498342 [Phlebiopsis gigantea 11061_1 CR5-6]|uniref:Cytochrome P450 n=1 Tax=Phlebiopsis gigantea (strain 11061_1 CR5-6) TaxID=745531 RepID=A0A0C3SFN9_PHLG1|nr:hypothetical protein PHLGIDRAFT_498342 [Phlebiopsis gigantea 11061_1 CR5-6]
MPFLLLAVLLAVLARRALLARAQHTRLPPGPKASWFGAVDLPKEYQWLTYAKWKQLYGDVIYIHIFGNPIVVLNSAEAVNDLFEKRSAIYSSRPVRTMINEVIGFDWLFSSMPYGPWWKRHRALFHQNFNSTNLPSAQPVVQRETQTLLRNLVESPDQLFYHVKRSSAAIVMMMSYGHQIAPEGDMYVNIADKALAGLAGAGIFGTYLVDYLSFLKHIPAWFPGASFKRQAAEWRQMNRSMLNLPFDMVKQRMAVGTAVPCFVVNELERLFVVGGDDEEEKLIKNVAATVYAAGADTTVSATLSFFLATMVHPEIQVKAQAQIDKVIGSDRLPTFEDRESLPYIDCIVWECLRWNPVTPLGLARKVTEDDEYRGYKIPKNTTVLPNVWLILHEEKMYPEPLRFNPDRFADDKRNSALGINELPLAAFGFGRRMCPGRWLAFETVWLTVATTLAAFNISKPKDDQGNVIEPDTNYTPASLSRPKPFKCSIMPRSDRAIALVHQAYDGA